MNLPGTVRLAEAGVSVHLAQSGALARLAEAGVSVVLAQTDLRLLPWVGTWDTFEAGGLWETEWAEGGMIGARDIGPATMPGARKWLTPRMSGNHATTGGVFNLEFLEVDTVLDGDGNPQAVDTPVNSSAFVLLGETLMDLAGHTIVTPPAPTKPVDAGIYVPESVGRYWTAPMPARGDVGLAAGAFAILQLRVLPLRCDAARWLPIWGAHDYAWWLANDGLDVDGVTLYSEHYLRWRAAFDAELAANARVAPMNILFLVSAPSA